MKRNWYALTILLLLALGLAAGGLYVQTSTAQLAQGLQAACALAEQGDYPAARRAYSELSARALQNYPMMTLLLRRNLVDNLGQTLATLPAYAAPDNKADLSVESARAATQLSQLQNSYLCPN